MRWNIKRAAVTSLTIKICTGKKSQRKKFEFFSRFYFSWDIRWCQSMWKIIILEISNSMTLICDINGTCEEGEEKDPILHNLNTLSSHDVRWSTSFLILSFLTFHSFLFHSSFNFLLLMLLKIVIFCCFESDWNGFLCLTWFKSNFGNKVLFTIEKC